MSDGESINPEVIEAQERGVTEADFISKESDYYVTVFSDLRKKNTQVYWNWAAFFLSAYWCFYRKMYNVGMAIVGIAALIRLLFGSSILSLALSIASGLLGNYFYMKHVEKEMERIRQLPVTQQQKYAMQDGGTSVGAVFLLILISIVLSTILYMFKRPYGFR